MTLNTLSIIYALLSERAEQADAAFKEFKSSVKYKDSLSCFEEAQLNELVFNRRKYRDALNDFNNKDWN